jgi:hypothetical protein
VITEEVLDTGRAVQVAERLEENNPDWVIMYGSYSREFVAFPVYLDAPDNSYCSAKDPAALGDHIRATERRHGRVRLTRRSPRRRRKSARHDDQRGQPGRALIGVIRTKTPAPGGPRPPGGPGLFVSGNTTAEVGCEFTHLACSCR